MKRGLSSGKRAGRRTSGAKPAGGRVAAAPLPAPERIVEFRSGVHLRGTVLWFDALHAREVCFVSRAALSATRRHQQVVTSAATARLLAPKGEDAPAGALITPMGRPFVLGKLRLELFRSGASFGASSLLVEHDGRRVVYAGDIGPRARATADAMELRRCDVLVLRARLGRPGTKLPPRAEVEARLCEMVERELRDGATPIVIAERFGAAPELAAVLFAAGFKLRAHAQVADAIRRHREAGAKVPAVRKLRGAPKTAEVVLWPLEIEARPSALTLEGVIRSKEPRRLLVSGLAADPVEAARVPHDAAFAWADTADHDELIAYIEATGAREIYLTHPAGEPLAAELRARGWDARALGPPRQMDLFGR